MLKNNIQRKEWIENLKNNYRVILENELVKVLKSKHLDDESSIIVIQVYTQNRGYDLNTHKTINVKHWITIGRYILLKDDKALHERSISELVDHMRSIKKDC